MHGMSLHLSKVRLNLSEIPFISECINLIFFFYFLLFLPNVIDSRIELVSYWVGLERWTLNFLLLGFNAMCTPQDLINSDLLGKSWEPHFGHKGSDLVLFRRNYWFKFWSYERKMVSLQNALKIQGVGFWSRKVLRLGRILEEKHNRYSDTIQKPTKQPSHKQTQTNKTPKTQKNWGNEDLVRIALGRTGQHEQSEKGMKIEMKIKRYFLQKETFERAKNH